MTRTERQARIRKLVAQNANRRWRERRIAEGKNPNASMLELLGESFQKYGPKIRETLRQPSIVKLPRGRSK